MNTSCLQLLFLTVLSASSILLHAHQRSVDMELLISTPENGAVFQDGEPIDLVVQVANHGPDALVTGDSLVLILPNGQATLMLLPEDVPVGNNLQVFQGQLSTNVDETSTVQFCIGLMDDPTTQAFIGGQPLVVSYTDPNPSNNSVCRTVTIELEGPSAVATVAGQVDVFQPYPNPVSNLLYLPVDPGTSPHILIYDMLGRTVYDKAYEAAALPAQGIVAVPVTGWAEGIYQVVRIQGAGRAVSKIKVRQP